MYTNKLGRIIFDRSLRPCLRTARLGAPGWAGENCGLFEHPAQALSYSAIYLNQALMGNSARMR
jgi:hypothetical protein